MSKIIKNIGKILLDYRFGLLILVLVSLAPLVGIGHGHDFFMHFRRYTLSAEYGVSTWFPYYAYWLIYPFAALPHPLGACNLECAKCVGVGLVMSLLAGAPCYTRACLPHHVYVWERAN